jgi:hypothetical protein
MRIEKESSGDVSMDGIIFFWFMWMIWVYVAFLMEKGSVRSQLSFCILLVIIAANYFMDIIGLKINIAPVIILIYGYYIIGQIPFKYFFYIIIGCGTLSIGYACIFMLAIYDPVWLLIDLKWIVSLIMVILTLLFFRETKMRFASLTVGLCHGEILYTLVILKLSPTKVIGDLYFLDILASSILICAAWYLFERMTLRWQEYIQKSIQEKKQVYRQ